MADKITFTLDTAALVAALNGLGPAMQTRILAASKETADAIVTEERARLRRQLGPHATGRTEAGIVARPAKNGNGYVVVAERDPMPSLPLWLEKGTKKGHATHANPARPYFYSSALLQESAHRRRIAQAVSDAIAAQGLGD